MKASLPEKFVAAHGPLTGSARSEERGYTEVGVEDLIHCATGHVSVARLGVEDRPIPSVVQHQARLNVARQRQRATELEVEPRDLGMRKMLTEKACRHYRCAARCAPGLEISVARADNHGRRADRNSPIRAEAQVVVVDTGQNI